jgi:hypothetical protein
MLCLGVVVASGTALAADAEYRRHSVPNQGVSLSLPGSWKTISAQEATRLAGSSLDDFVRAHPELAGVVAQLGQKNSPLKFFAFDPVPLHGFATNVNVVVSPLPGGISFPRFRQAIVQEVKTLPMTGLADSEVRLPGGRAVRLTYRLHLTARGKPLTVATTQYAFPHGTRAVVVTYTTLPDALRAYGAVFSTSARSISFG